MAIYRLRKLVLCYTSSVLRKSRHIKQVEKLRTAAKIKTQDCKIEPNYNYNPSSKHSYKTVKQSRSQTAIHRID